MSAVPPNDQWFNLKVDAVDPTMIVTLVGSKPEDWKYLGPEFAGRKTYRVKLVHLGYGNLAHARMEADRMNLRLVEGQASRSFKDKFPKPDGNGPIIFGGSEWQFLGGRTDVVYLNGFENEWVWDFSGLADDFAGFCRWLVVGKTLKRLGT